MNIASRSAARGRRSSAQTPAAGLTRPAYPLGGRRLGAETPERRINLFAQNLTDARGLLGNTIGLPRPGVSYSIAVAQPRTYGLSLTKRW